MDKKSIKLSGVNKTVSFNQAPDVDSDVLESIDIRLSDLLEITERQAVKLFNSGKAVYLVTDDNKPEQCFNAFVCRKGIQDAGLNYYCPNIETITLEEQISFIRRNQIEPIYFYTFNSVQLWII